MYDTTATDAPAIIELGADLSPAVKALETAYRMIQRKFPEVPNATIVVKRDSKAWGHTTVAKHWSPASAEQADRLEIMISGENLARGAEYVAATLLHESAHAWDLALGIMDTDVNGRHNKLFKLRAEMLGLTVEQNGWHGWTATTLTDEQKSDSLVKRIIATLARGLAKSAKAAAPAPVIAPTITVTGISLGVGTVAPPRKRGNRNLIKAVCGDCGASIRASRGVLENCEPTCKTCDQPFVEV